jgi:hypothetical protein
MEKINKNMIGCKIKGQVGKRIPDCFLFSKKEVTSKLNIGAEMKIHPSKKK